MFDAVARRYDVTNDVLSLGQDRRWRSQVIRALAPLPRGALFVAAYKESLFDYTPASDSGSSGQLAAGRSYSTLVLTIDGRGRPTPPKPIDAGGDVLPTAALATGTGEVLLGGSLAGRAAIFHVSTPP